jgi:hypothetical protein
MVLDEPLQVIHGALQESRPAEAGSQMQLTQTAFE